MDSPLPDLSDEHKRLIEHEVFIAKVLEQRKGKTERQSALDRPGVIAIVAGLIGAIASFVPQWWSRHSEISESRRQTTQAKRAETVATAFRAVGSLQVSADNLIVIKGGSLATRPDEEERYWREANAADEAWRRERYAMAALLALYFGASSKTVDEWSNVARALEDYCGCAQDLWESTQPKVPKDFCDPKHAVLTASIDRLRDAVAANALEEH